MTHAEKAIKQSSKLLQSLLNILSMFKMRIWYDNNNVIEGLGIKCTNFNKCFGYELEDQTLREVIIAPLSSTNVVFKNVGIYWIIELNYQLNFDFQYHCPNCIINGPWYNTTICSHLYGDTFDNYFKNAHKDRYNLMFYIEAYNKLHPTCADSAISDGVRPVSDGSTTYLPALIGNTLNFIDNCLQ